MTSIQQVLLGSGGGGKKTYIDDVFSTFLYTGNASDKTITNNIDFSDKGGLVWLKNLDQNNTHHALVDTARGASYYLSSSSNAGNAATGANNNFNSFTSTGFTLKDDNGNDYFNKNNTKYASWSFAKSPGFFDIVEWTQSGSNGSARTLSHGLGCMPGFIMLKQTDATENWICWHRDFTTNQFVKLNSDHSIGTDANASVNSVTSTQFVVGADNNKVGSYIAYVFGGGSSSESTACSVDLDGNDSLQIDHSSLAPGTGDFTIECWVKLKDLTSGSGGNKGIFHLHETLAGGTLNGIALLYNWTSANSHRWQVYAGGSPFETSGRGRLGPSMWTHVAITKTNGYVKLWVDGDELLSQADTTDYSDEDYMNIGHAYSYNGYAMKGSISNFKYTKGQALYTSTFTPSTTPLTTTSQGSTASNVVLLCCNNSSVTGSTVTPATINVGNNPAANIESPFHDTTEDKYGNGGEEGIIRAGMYTGTGAGGVDESPEVNLGFEPQWILIRSGGSADWYVWDSMRGICHGGADHRLLVNVNGRQVTGTDWLELTAEGFRISTSDSKLNGDFVKFYYLAIRRPDPLVAKEYTASEVFAQAMHTAATTSSNAFVSGFPVDFAWGKLTTSGGNWWTSARLIQDRELKMNLNDVGGSAGNKLFDSQAGWHTDTGLSGDYISHMWRRSAGFDVLAYYGGEGPAGKHRHNLASPPEMIWLKNRTWSGNWLVYHSGLDGGNQPETHYTILNSSAGEGDDNGPWQDKAPTDKYFWTGGWSTASNNASYKTIALLFCTVAGISKVGRFTNAGGTTTVSCGFQPRFIICKAAGSGNWYVYDTVRGINAGGEPTMNLNSDAASTTHTVDDLDINSDGFTIPTSSSNIGYAGNHIFYAHA